MGKDWRYVNCLKLTLHNTVYRKRTDFHNKETQHSKQNRRRNETQVITRAIRSHTTYFQYLEYRQSSVLLTSIIQLRTIMILTLQQS